VVLDSFGRPLAKPGEENDDPLGAAQLEKQQRIEREMSARVVALLEPVVGVERVRVNVAVKLNPQSQEETEERWDPNTVLRSHQTTSDTSVAGSAASIGGAAAPVPVAGSRGNLPASATSVANAGTAVTNSTGPSSTRTAETSNFEISRTTRRTIMPPGDIQRLSVAVILDDDQQATTGQDGSVTTKSVPRSPEDLQKIQGLVSAAVGLEPDRGDQLTVQNVSFEEAAPALPDEPKTVVERVQEYTPQIWEGARMIVVMAIALVALLFVVRPMLRTAATFAVAAPAASGSSAAILPPGQAPRTVADLESEIEARLDAAAAQGAEGRRLPVLTKRVTAISDSEPENVAKLLRGWIAEGER
jgi:flagellar M-ring protein FliF